jgi:hypothetical protein
MGAILQDLFQTHPTDLTRRTGRKTVSVKGRLIDMAQVKRFIRRKGLPAFHAEAWPDTRSSQAVATTCSIVPVPFSVDAMNTSPHTSTPDEDVWQSMQQKSTYLDLYPLHSPLRAEDPRLCQSMFQNSDPTAQKRTWASTSDPHSSSGEERQPKRQRSSQQTPTCPPLACPFYKNNPSYYSPQNPDAEAGRKYRCCAGPGWTSIHRLRWATSVVLALLF